MLTRIQISRAAALVTAVLALGLRPAAGQGLVAHADFPVLTPSTATLKASLSTPAQVWLCWGRANGGTNFTSWEGAIPLGSRPAGLVAAPLAGLTVFQEYFFAWRAVAGSAESWTTPASFRPQQPGMFYQTGFETGELFPFAPGNLDFQGGSRSWRVNSGTAVVSTGGRRSAQGVQSASGSFGINLTNVASPVVWLDCFVMDAGSTNQPMLPANAASALLCFSAANGLLALEGDGAGGGYFVQVQPTLPTNEFVRVTLRLDYTAKRYDVWVDGLRRRTGLGFKDNSAPAFSAFARPSDQPAAFDDFSLSTWGLDADSDGDGLNDLDEAKFYGSYPLLADSDGDGVNDLQEVIAGTAPGDAGSRFALQMDSDAQGLPRVTLPTITGREYTLQRRAALEVAWENAPGATALAGNGLPWSYSETNRAPAMFYRGEVALPGGLPKP